MLDNDYDEIKNRVVIPFLKKELEEDFENSGINNFDEENANLTTPANNVNLNAAKLKDGCENLHHIFKYFW